MAATATLETRVEYTDLFDQEAHRLMEDNDNLLVAQQSSQQTVPLEAVVQALATSSSPPSSDDESSGRSDESDNEGSAINGEDIEEDVDEVARALAKLQKQQQKQIEKEKIEKRKAKIGSHTHLANVIASVIVVQDGKLLMMQEAKKSCRGKWYIPAGRVEPGESPLEGAIREVKEETGLDFIPTGIFAIEFKAREAKNWVRYGVTGTITGGTLKTYEDKESMNAEWVELDKIEERELRNKDCLRLLEAYNQGRSIQMVYSLNPESQAQHEEEQRSLKA